MKKKMNEKNIASYGTVNYTGYKSSEISGIGCGF